MLFTSWTFVIYASVSVLLYYILPKKLQPKILLVSSIIFYAYAGVEYLLFLFATIITVFIATNKIEDLKETQKANLSNFSDKAQKKEYKAKIHLKQKKWFLSCLILNFGILAVVKYTDFVISNINVVVNTVSEGSSLPLLNIILPMGISFYTFQSMSYLIDVFWGKQKAERNFFNYALFASFFPQMIQGPISRYSDLSKTMFSVHKFEQNNFYSACVRVLYGYFKKMIIADRLIPVIALLVANPDQYQGIYVIAVMFLYAICLYADFTGGIDITIGVAKMFGIDLVENFNKPFLSVSIAEYWRKWHITMGTWFRDYIFYPLSVSKKMLKFTTKSRKVFGGNLGKRIPVYVSTMILWFLTGLWHGAAWNFIVWGMVNGLVILISQELSPLYAKFHKKFPKAKTSKSYFAFSVFRTFWLMNIIRVFDCYANVPLTFKMFGSIFTNLSINEFLTQGLAGLGVSSVSYIAALYGTIFLLFVGYITRKSEKFEDIAKRQNYITKTAIVFFLVFSIIIFGAYGIGFDSSQFIYNQF
ncbi:MAG: MBOAT family O-acyltransferase [Clostridia bacterium]